MVTSLYASIHAKQAIAQMVADGDADSLRTLIQEATEALARLLAQPASGDCCRDH